MSEPRNSPGSTHAGVETAAVGAWPLLEDPPVQQPAAAGSAVGAVAPSAAVPARPMGGTVAGASIPVPAAPVATTRAQGFTSARLGVPSGPADAGGHLTAPAVTRTASHGSPAPAPTHVPGSISAPIQIVAAAVGVTLVAVSAAMVTLKHGPPAPAPAKVATFHVDDHDVPLFWHDPDAAER